MENKILELRKKGYGYKKIAKILKISSLQVSKILIKNNIVDHIKIEEDKQQKIIELYKNHNIAEIAKKINVSQASVTNVLLLNNIEMTKKACHKNHENKVNENYFKVINTKEKAYWLGFLYADGYINEKTYQVELSLCEKDKSHIEKFQKCIKSSYKITKRNINGHIAYRTIIYSKKITMDLTKLGCNQKKSLTLKPPTEKQVPKKYIKDFIRGYVDGDGCFSSGRIFCIVGTKEMLNFIIDYLQNNTTISKAGSFSKTGNAWQWYHNSKKDFKIIHDFLYKNSKIYLTRKKYLAVIG